jgi:large subunit ribosomal protein L22
MEIRAVQKNVITSPRKLREVALMIKKLTPDEAVEILPLVEKRAAEPLLKTIKTAIANAKQKGVTGGLVFKEIQINEGPRYKRGRAGARGRVKPYKKRLSHIRIILESTQEEKVKKPKKVEKKVEKTKEFKGKEKKNGTKN